MSNYDKLTAEQEQALTEAYPETVEERRAGDAAENAARGTRLLKVLPLRDVLRQRRGRTVRECHNAVLPHSLACPHPDRPCTCVGTYEPGPTHVVYLPPEQQ